MPIEARLQMPVSSWIDHKSVAAEQAVIRFMEIRITEPLLISSIALTTLPVVAKLALYEAGTKN